MSKTLTTHKTPLAITSENKDSSSPDLQIFLAASLSMGWKLAIAVLVPVVGGYELDKALGSTPVCTILGLVVAMVLTAKVLAMTLKAYVPLNNTNGGKK